MYDILQKLDSVSEGLDANQQSVKQLPALFKPKNISTVLGNPYKQHPMAGELVGEEIEDPAGSAKDAVVSAITRRIIHGRPELLMNYGIEAVKQAIDDEAEWVGLTNMDEIGSSDVSAWVNNIARRLAADAEHQASQQNEDVVSDVAQKLGDMLQDLVGAAKNDKDLKSKDDAPKGVDSLGPAVKTINTDDGREIKIHGNEDDGFRISVKNKVGQSKFNNVDEAVMAVEMFCARKNMLIDRGSEK